MLAIWRAAAPSPIVAESVCSSVGKNWMSERGWVWRISAARRGEEMERAARLRSRMDEPAGVDMSRRGMGAAFERSVLHRPIRQRCDRRWGGGTRCK